MPALAVEMGVPLISNQPRYSMLWRIIEAEVDPASRRLGRATDARGTRFVGRYMSDAVLERVRRLRPLAAEAGLTMALLKRIVTPWATSSNATPPKRPTCST